MEHRGSSAWDIRDVAVAGIPLTGTCIFKCYHSTHCYRLLPTTSPLSSYIHYYIQLFFGLAWRLNFCYAHFHYCTKLHPRCYTMLPPLRLRSQSTQSLHWHATITYVTVTSFIYIASYSMIVTSAVFPVTLSMWHVTLCHGVYTKKL